MLRTLAEASKSEDKEQDKVNCIQGPTNGQVLRTLAEAQKIKLEIEIESTN